MRPESVQEILIENFSLFFFPVHGRLSLITPIACPSPLVHYAHAGRMTPLGRRPLLASSVNLMRPDVCFGTEE